MVRIQKADSNRQRYRFPFGVNFEPTSHTSRHSQTGATNLIESEERGRIVISRVAGLNILRTEAIVQPRMAHKHPSAQTQFDASLQNVA